MHDPSLFCIFSIVRIFAAVFLSFLYAIPASAVIITAITVNGNRRMDDESIRIMSGASIGDNITNNELNEIARRLHSSGHFSEISATLDGNRLLIRLAEAPIINQVTIEGNSKVSSEDLRKEIRLAARNPFTEATVGADVQRMLMLYQRMGLYGTRIEPQKISLPNNRMNIVYEITEGTPTRINNIKFTGNRVFSGRVLRNEIISREYRWWRFMTQFDVYDADRIQFDQQMLRQFYLRHGFADFAIKSAKGSFNADRTEFNIVYDLFEGPQYKIGTITINNPFSDVEHKSLERELRVRKGQIYNIDNVENTISRLRGRVANYGYAFINVDVIPSKNIEEKTIDLIFDIQKTSRVYIQNVNILGNVRTFDSVIEQLLQVRGGDPFSLNEVEAARQRIMRTQYFKSTDMVPSRVPDTNMMNLDVRVDEQPTGELSGGLGWSNINGFMIDAGITEKNFMGRGQVVQLRGTLAQFQRQLAFSFTEPYLLGRQLSAGFDINYTQYMWGSLGGFGFDRDSLSLAGRLGWRLTENWSQTVRLSAMFDQNFDLQSTDGWEHVQLYTLGTMFRYHNLDTNFVQQTHTGFVGNLGAAYTGFGSSETFMRFNGDITGLYKFFDDRWQFKTNLEAGAISMMGGDYLSRMYRYFLGGENLRGFDIAGVGSRNWLFQNYTLGGMWKINGSTQVNFPIFIPDEYQVKGFVFMDYGILGAPPEREKTFCQPGTNLCGYNHIDETWRVSYGFGVYWNTPMGPMNFSWGFPLASKWYDREQRFLLSFATQF